MPGCLVGVQPAFQLAIGLIPSKRIGLSNKDGTRERGDEAIQIFASVEVGCSAPPSRAEETLHLECANGRGGLVAQVLRRLPRREVRAHAGALSRKVNTY